MTYQIALGTLLLSYSALVHVGIIAASMNAFDHISPRFTPRRTFLGRIFKICAALFFIVLGHTIQIWSWAAIFFWLEAFTTFETSFYFSIVTYTTLGYGDLLPGIDIRIFAAFCAITGLLTFGISTAFLISILERLDR